MTTAAKIETTDIVVANDGAQVVLFERDKFDAFYAKLKADVDATPIDLKTDKGRKAIASAAAKVRTEKASIDRDRKRLTQEWRDMTAQVNGAWKVIEAQLDELAVEARKPLTEWEEAEKERIDRCNDIIGDIMGAAIVTLEDTSETVRERGMKVWAIEIGEDFGALAHDAEQAKSATVSTLQAALARLKQEEADKAELEKLRAEAAERDRIEAERLAAEQAAQQAAEEAQRRQDEFRRVEETRIAAEKADAERIERARQEAADNARREVEESARKDREAEAALKQAEIDAANERAAKAERDAQAERDRIAQADAERERIAAEEAAEQARKEKNRAHRAQIMGEAKIAIMAAGPVDEAAAVAIVKAIVAGSIPHITLRF